MTVDQLEVLLRTVPQWTIFIGTALYIFGWSEKRNYLHYVAEAVFIIAGASSLWVLSTGMIPGPDDPAYIEETIKPVFKMLSSITIIGLFALISLIVRLILKKGVKALVALVFVYAMIVFFMSTKLSKVAFELNPTTEQVDSIKNALNNQ